MLRWKQTNKQKKTTSKYHCWTICFFRVSCQFLTTPIIAQMETNKQTKKRQLPNNTDCWTICFFRSSSQFWHPQKSINVLFFFDFRHKAVWWTLLLLFASPFYCNQRFCIQRLFLLKGFSVIKKREVYLCWQDFFLLGFGNKGFGQTNKKHLFSLKQTVFGIRKKKG